MSDSQELSQPARESPPEVRSLGGIERGKNHCGRQQLWQHNRTAMRMSRKKKIKRNSAASIACKLGCDVGTAIGPVGSEWTHETAKTIRTKSPTSTKLAFRQIREGKKISFDDCMRMEFRMVNRVVSGQDFYEGVRATIIDKDNAPKWKPAAIADVSDAEIAAYFAPLGTRELAL